MNRMRTSLVMISLLLVLAPGALAGRTWYVDGMNGGDNNCQAPQTACKT